MGLGWFVRENGPRQAGQKMTSKTSQSPAHFLEKLKVNSLALGILEGELLPKTPVPYKRSRINIYLAIKISELKDKLV